jgi:hypothetical protein
MKFDITKAGDSYGCSCETDTVSVRALDQTIQEEQQVAVQVV